jgi:hypothetical protein
MSIAESKAASKTVCKAAPVSKTVSNTGSKQHAKAAMRKQQCESSNAAPAESSNATPAAAQLGSHRM